MKLKYQTYAISTECFYDKHNHRGNTNCTIGWAEDIYIYRYIDFYIIILLYALMPLKSTWSCYDIR